MDFIRRNKLLGSTVIVLLILNVVLLIFLWLGRPENNRQIKGPENKGRFLEEQLNLSPEQTSQLEILKKEHFRLINQYQREFNETRRQLHNLLGEENSEQKAKTVSAKMGDIQSKIEFATFNHFASIRAICTPNQQQTFDRIISEVLRKGPEGNRPPPRGGR